MRTTAPRRRTSRVTPAGGMMAFPGVPPALRAVSFLAGVAVVLVAFSACRSTPPSPGSSAPGASTRPPAAASGAGAADAAAGEPAWPAGLDPAIPLPLEARILAIGSDGRALLDAKGYEMRTSRVRLTLPGEPSSPSRSVAAEVSVTAVLDLATMCIEEAHVFRALDRARDPDRTGLAEKKDLAAPLNDPDVQADLAHVRALGRRFGVRNLADVAVGEPEGAYVTGDPTFLYASRGGVFRDVGWGAAYSPVAAPDGRSIALAACGSPCNGFYPVRLFDPGTQKTRSTTSGAASHDLHWLADGRTLVFGYDETRTGTAQARSYCVGALDRDTAKQRTFACVKGDPPVSGSFAISPGGTALAVSTSASDDIVVYAVGATATELRRVPARTTTDLQVDDDGRIGWSANDGADFHFRVHVAGKVGAPTVHENARLVGLLPGQAVLVLPSPSPSDASVRVATLREASRCGYFQRLAPPP